MSSLSHMSSTLYCSRIPLVRIWAGKTSQLVFGTDSGIADQGKSKRGKEAPNLTDSAHISVGRIKMWLCWRSTVRTVRLQLV